MKPCFLKHTGIGSRNRQLQTEDSGEYIYDNRGNNHNFIQNVIDETNSNINNFLNWGTGN